MTKCKYNVINTIETNARTEKELIKIFNKKLASIIIKLESKTESKKVA